MIARIIKTFKSKVCCILDLNTVTLWATWHPTVMGFEQAYAASGKVKHGSHYAMQDMTSEICNNVTVPSEQSTATLVDTRDNNTYTVAKLMDERCWMTQNLRIKNSTLTANDSDVTSNFILPDNNFPGHTYNSTMVYVDENKTYGGYYNFYTATAGFSLYSSAREATTSLCAKGWKLPNDNEARSMIGHYSFNTIQQEPANFIPVSVDYTSQKTINPDGKRGHWFTANHVSNGVNSNTINLFESGPTLNVGTSINSGYGYNMRCVSRNN